MLRLLPKIKITLLLILLYGCSTVYKIGQEFDFNNVSKIKIGTTTQKDVIDYFGQPLRKGISNGNEVYYYSNEIITFNNDKTVKRDGNSLLIEFDEKGIVKNYYLNIPGKDTMLFGYLIHKLEMQKKINQVQQFEWGGLWKKYHLLYRY